MDKEFYSTKELAELLGVRPLTLFRHVQQGELVALRVGRVYRFRRRDIEDWLNRNRVLPKGAAPDPTATEEPKKKGKVKHG